MKILMFCAGIIFSFATIQSQVPENCIGNWINEKNNNWEYGFFENFAIYDCDFWDYASINVDKAGDVSIVLQKGSEQLALKLIKIDGNHLKIKADKGKYENFVLMEKQYPRYRNPDTGFFSPPVFRSDSATIIGYYRNLDKIPAQFTNWVDSSPFEVNVVNFLSDKEEKYYADIDSVGRFKITFSIIGTQRLFVDWHRAAIQTVVEPRDVLFLFADMSDYIPQESDKSYEDYSNRSKQVLFMGKNARINNEIRQYKNPLSGIDPNSLKDVSDMDFLQACEDMYNKRVQTLNEYIEKNPYVSERFRFFEQEYERFSFACDLMQRRFHSYSKADKSLQDGFIQYVEEKFSLENEAVYMLTRGFKTLLRDYIGYIEDIKKPRSLANLLDNVEKKMLEDGTMTDEIKEQFESLSKLTAEMKLTNDPQLLSQKIQPLANQLFSNSIVDKTAILLNEERMLDTTIADSLITNSNLRELWTASRYYYWFDNLRKPLSAYQQNVFKAKINNPFLLNYIDELNKYYTDIAGQEMLHDANLRNTENLQEYQDVDKLFEELIKDYKGKVIYVDFWGTWCGPCRENMKYANDVKEKLKGEDVVFMYFANRSPEESWKNVIKELNLAGENVVHYRLPEQQQTMIERKFSVNSFPTYMLIDKKGTVVNTKAAPPRNTNEVIKQIKDLLK